MKILFFNNGNTAMFDEAGQQLPDLQESWLVLFLRFLESRTIDPLTCQITLPDGKTAIPFRMTNGHWNWDIKCHI